MNIADYVEIAYTHFSQMNSVQSQTIFETYAAEELGKTGADLDEFTQMVTQGNIEPATDEEHNRFYTWYYLNHMSTPKDNPWNTRVYDIPVSDITKTTIERVALREEDGSPITTASDANRAHHFAIYAHSASEGKFCIMECIDESTAYRLQNTITNLIEHWPVRLLIDVKNQQISNILTTHPMEYLIVDRDILKIHPDQMDLKAINILKNATTGQFYKHFQLIDPTDIKIEKLIQLLAF
jgi:hypothetical protein